MIQAHFFRYNPTLDTKILGGGREIVSPLEFIPGGQARPAPPSNDAYVVTSARGVISNATKMSKKSRGIH